jgi:hypothetical protein
LQLVFTSLVSFCFLSFSSLSSSDAAGAIALARDRAQKPALQQALSNQTKPTESANVSAPATAAWSPRLEGTRSEGSGAYAISSKRFNRVWSSETSCPLPLNCSSCRLRVGARGRQARPSSARVCRPYRMAREAEPWIHYKWSVPEEGEDKQGSVSDEEGHEKNKAEQHYVFGVLPAFCPPHSKGASEHREAHNQVCSDHIEIQVASMRAESGHWAVARAQEGRARRLRVTRREWQQRRGRRRCR